MLSKMIPDAVEVKGSNTIEQKEERITQLEERLAALEAKTEKTFDFGMLPGEIIVFGRHLYIFNKIIRCSKYNIFI